MIALRPVSGQADATDYIVDPARSELVVRLFKAGFAAAFAHNHVIRATRYSGKASFDPGNLSTASVRIEVQADSLMADEPEIREKYGLTKQLRVGDREKIQSTMLSAEQMHVNRYPTMEFRSTSIEKRSQKQYIVTGDLTIHGVTRSVTFPVMVEQDDVSLNGQDPQARELQGRATVRFRQSDFGIKPYSAMLGAVRNKDEVVLYADIVVIPQPGAESGN
ncbi:MAG: YceI family protein [Candidatus Hydrogenedentota bacterium]|nr:MAG: YceI family protein [Candidatus Hydrogenedentota bacterium]